MNKCILQFWEESSRESGVFPDGCSLHINIDEHKNFIRSFYSTRDESVPNEYERIFGAEMFCYISDTLYNRLSTDSNIRLSESEKNNLVMMEEIIINMNEII